jgi:peptidoglycan hydrolase-like protein with peptidoglycan-binding domain
MAVKGNKRIFGKRHLSYTIIAALFSVTLIFGTSGIVGSPLQQQPQQQQQEAYASSQAAVPPPQSAPPTQAASFVPTRICNPNSPTLQPGSTGAKVIELQRVLTQVGYGSMLGQSGVDGKFGLSTQNAVKKFQQDNRIPVDGKVGPITWGALCSIVPNSFIIQLKSTNPEMVGNLRETLTAAGGTIAAIYDQFRMLNVRFEHPPTNMEQFINSLKAHPAVQGIFYDAISTLGQTTSSSNQLIQGV